jgi:mono/diheme cytochrome c family protein
MLSCAGAIVSHVLEAGGQCRIGRRFQNAVEPPMKPRRAIAAIPAFFMLTLLPAASAAADAEGHAQAGLAYAEEVCSGCHSVGAGGKTSPNIKAPPFQVIASSTLVTSREIEAWLMSSHPDMPDLMVPADKRADMLAYLKSLGHKQ